MNAVEIKDLIFSYQSVPVLDVADMTVKKGEIVFLHGPSGSGKSTLLELLSGVLRVQAGTLSVCGKSLTGLSMAELDRFRAEKVGYIFQSFNLIPYLSVIENIQLPFLFNRPESGNADPAHLLASLGLTAFANRPVGQLSVGQQQRVAVARALIKSPEIILADEPTSALDQDHRENFLKILFELCRKNRTTVLFVSHDLTIEKYFDRSVSIKDINRVRSESGAGL